MREGDLSSSSLLLNGSRQEEPVKVPFPDKMSVDSTNDTTATADYRALNGPVPFGPPFRLCWAWAVSLDGSEYVALALWIGKDWSWSQLGWSVPALFFGTLATIWIIAVGIVRSTCHHQGPLYSEVYKNVCLLLWLIGLYAWMVGEFWTLWYTEGVGRHALVYEEIGNTVAKWVLMTAVLLYAVFLTVLLPLDVFTLERHSRVLEGMEANSPSYPAKGYFKEFRTFASLHFFTWI